MSSRIWAGIVAPVALVSVLLLVIAIGSAIYIQNMQASVADMLAENVMSVRAAQDLELSVRDLRTQGVRYLLTSDPATLEPIPRLRERVMNALKEAERLASTPPEEALMKRTRAGLQAFFTEYDHMTQGNPNKAEYGKTLALIDSLLAREVIEPTREYLRLNEGMLAKSNEENGRIASRMTTALVILGLCGPAAGLLAGWVISSVIRRNQRRTEERLRSTARQLDEAVRTAEVNANRAGRSVDALDDVAKSASAVLGRLKQTEKDALRAEQLAWAGQMAAGIAHEVRNPLMAIKLLIQALAEGRTGDRLRPRDIAVLEEEILRLEQIVASFLDFARPPRPERRPVDLAALATEVAQRVCGRANLQDVSLNVSIPDSGVIADLDANQLQQVLYNLLFNALDALPSGGRVEVSVDRDGGRAVLRVADNGPGLPQEVRDRLFEPFVSTKDSGMGLGLSICRRIIESHGGAIVSETTGSGASFVVRLPLSEDDHPSRQRLRPVLAKV